MVGYDYRAIRQCLCANKQPNDMLRDTENSNAMQWIYIEASVYVAGDMADKSTEFMYCVLSHFLPSYFNGYFYTYFLIYSRFSLPY